MFFKAFNDLIKPNGLILTLLIFDGYSCISDIDILLLTIHKRNIAIYKTMKKVRRSYAFCQVNNALNTKNCFFICLIDDLPINSPVLVFCKKNAN